MKQPFSSDSYEFIGSYPDGGVPTGPDTRRLIRRQAMSRAAAARKQRGSWGQHNRRQYPMSHVDLGEQEEAENALAAAPGSARTDLGARHCSLFPTNVADLPIPASIHSSGYESMRIRYGFDLLDVSALTTFHTGRITAQILFSNPSHLAHVLRYRQRSYFSFLPRMYGHTACLDNAAHCVVARIRQWMHHPSDPPSKFVLSLYHKSLASLQSALNDPGLYLKPEILCATSILAIYELLNNTSDQAWVRHIAGAKALMKVRGPQCYQTDFEKALFLAHVGPIYTEALLNDERCFLEQANWQNVLRSTVCETVTLSDSSGIVVSLWTIVCPIPSLFKDIQNIICNNSTCSIDIRTIESLSARIRHIRTLLLQWHSQYEQDPLSQAPPEQSSGGGGAGKHYDTLGIYMANRIIINRLSVSLHPRSSGTQQLENETQDLARQLIQLEQRASSANPRASLFMAFKVVAAQAALDTKDEWQQAVETSIESDTIFHTMISKQVFEHWVKLKGRRITTSLSATTTEEM